MFEPLCGSIKHDALHDENLEEILCYEAACPIVFALSDSL